MILPNDVFRCLKFCTVCALRCHCCGQVYHNSSAEIHKLLTVTTAWSLRDSQRISKVFSNIHLAKDNQTKNPLQTVVISIPKQLEDGFQQVFHSSLLDRALMKEMGKQYLFLSSPGRDSEAYAPWAAAATYPRGTNTELRAEARACSSKLNL